MKKVVILILSLAASICISFSQEGKFSVTSNIDSVLLFIDTSYIGNTPVYNISLHPGEYILKGVRKKVGIWGNEVIEKKILIKTGDSLMIRLNFKKKLQIITVPDNAKIFLNDIFIGSSPTNIFYQQNDIIRIEKESFSTEFIKLDSLRNDFLKIILEMKEGSTSAKTDNIAIKKNGNNKIIYYLIGSGLAFGISAVVTKTHADDLANEYETNHDQNVKNKIRIYDSVSGVLLTFFEGCFLMLSYLLLSN